MHLTHAPRDGNCSRLLTQQAFTHCSDSAWLRGPLFQPGGVVSRDCKQRDGVVFCSFLLCQIYSLVLVALVFVKSLASLLAKILLVKQLFYLWMRADDFAVARMHLDSRLMNHVEAGIVGKLEYAHWKKHLELDSRIDGSHCDIVPFPAVNCFVHKWNEDAV